MNRQTITGEAAKDICGALGFEPDKCAPSFVEYMADEDFHSLDAHTQRRIMGVTIFVNGGLELRETIISRGTQFLVKVDYDGLVEVFQQKYDKREGPVGPQAPQPSGVS